VKPQLRAFSGVMCVEMVANIGPTVSIQRGGGIVERIDCSGESQHGKISNQAC
jgi:hypothetical protein